MAENHGRLRAEKSCLGIENAQNRVAAELTAELHGRISCHDRENNINFATAETTTDSRLDQKLKRPAAKTQNRYNLRL
jgi:hypothetical protein